MKKLIIALLWSTSISYGAESLGEAPEARAARYVGQVLDAARDMAVVGSKINPSMLSRSGALPPELLKWGQIKNPYREGQFLDIESADDGSVSVIIPSIPKSMCAKALTELSMIPSLDSFQAGDVQFFVGTAWHINNLEALCDVLAKNPSKATAGKSSRFVNPKKERSFL